MGWWLEAINRFMCWYHHRFEVPVGKDKDWRCFECHHHYAKEPKGFACSVCLHDF